MKKAIYLLLALAMCLSLFACGSAETAPNDVSEPDTAPDESVITEYTPTDVELCAQYAIDTLTQYLKFPETLLIHDLYGVETEDSYIIAIQYSAENSYGEYVTDNLFLDVLITDSGFATRTYGSGTFEESDNQKYTAQFCAKNKKKNGYFVFDTNTLLVSTFIESQVTAEIVEFEGKLKGKNESYEGAWNVKIGDDDYLKLVYFAEGVDLSWYENFTGNPYAVTISALLEDGNYYDAVIIADPVLDATDDEHFARFNMYDKKYYAEYVQAITPMTEEEIGAALTDNTFKMRNNYGGDGDGTHTVTFYADGNFDANYTGSDGQVYTMYNKWYIADGKVVAVNPDGKEVVLTAYQIDDTKILLLEEDDLYYTNSMALRIGE